MEVLLKGDNDGNQRIPAISPQPISPFGISLAKSDVLEKYDNCSSPTKENSNLYISAVEKNSPAERLE
jgi:hypothetical protein